MGFKGQIGLQFGGELKNIWEKEKRRGRGRRRREEEEEEIKQKGMELYGFVWISCLDICLWVVGDRKPNPRMNLCMELITNPFVSLGFCFEKT